MIKKITLSLITSLLALFTLAGCGHHQGTDFAEYQGMTAQTIFVRAEHELAKHKYSNAVKDLQALDALYPFGPYAERGQRDMIYAQYKKGDDASAILAADRYVRLYPRGRYIDYAYYMQGVIHSEVGFTFFQRLAHVDPASRDLTDRKAAYLAFQTLVQQFPHSPYAHDAALRMVYLRNIIAAHELKIAQYYLKRGAYLASANRAAFVVSHFSGTPAVLDALAIMVRSYRQLGMYDLAYQALTILEHNYPHSSQLAALMPKVHGRASRLLKHSATLEHLEHPVVSLNHSNTQAETTAAPAATAAPETTSPHHA